MNCSSLNFQNPVSFTTKNIQKNQTAPSGSAEFSQNPQDKVVLAPGTYTVSGLLGGEMPEVEKAHLEVPLAPVDGKYVFPEADPGFHAANSFSAVARTIKFFEEGTGQSISWAFSQPKLGVVPDGGDMLNAYYQRQNGNVNFFHSTDPVTNEVVFSGDSGEVVSHECGHAILDALRPGYLMSWKTDPGAFHESFGDMLALLMSVQDDAALAKVVDQTGGDMSKRSVMSNLGEELGVTINHVAGYNRTGGDWTRTAINKFTWKDPKTLENNPKDPDQLGSEVHNFSRLWTGAFYDVFSGLVAENQAAGMDAASSIREASNEGLRMLGRFIKASPKFNPSYKDLAKAFVASDKANGGKHVDLITNVYKAREILPADFNAADVQPADQGMGLQDEPIRKERVQLNGNFGNFSGASVEVVRDPESRGIADGDDDVQGDIKKLIDSGRILYTEPNQKISNKDLFDKNGTPYAGVLRWTNGEAVIERNPVVA